MILVFSCGRTGTNLVLEIMSGSRVLDPSIYPEDKQIFKRDILYPYNYLTKSDTVYCENYGLFGQFMKKNWHCKVLWTVRHPYDVAMSKIYRGWGHADDATLKGCVKDMFYMAYMYKEAINEFPNRVMTVKMEDVIKNLRLQVGKICMFTDIPFEEIMLHPNIRMRHELYRKEYSQGVYNNIENYKRWRAVYNGFFVDKIDFDIRDLFEKIKVLTKTFNYEDDQYEL